MVRACWRGPYGAVGLAGIAIAVTACHQPRAFHCDVDTECLNAGIPGRCETNGFCSFADLECVSGSRFGEHAPDGIRGTCVASPGNDGCEAGPALTFGEPADGALRGATASTLLSCSPQVTGDAFYALELTECSDVTVRAEAVGANLAVGVLSQCDEVIGCVDASQTSTPEVLELPGVPPGTYQVGVGGVFYDGPFAVTATIADPPANDTPTTALDITAAITNPQRLARAADDLACDGRAGARDLFYELTLADVSPDRWVVDVEAVGQASSDFAIASLDDDPPTCVPADAGPVRFHDVSGTAPFKFAVDGPADGSCGHFDLRVATTRVQDNNRCEGRERLDPPLDKYKSQPPVAPLTAFGDLRFATDEYSGACGGAGGNDAVYEIEVVNERIRADIRVTEVSGGFTPIVYVRPAGACTTAAELDKPAAVCGPPDSFTQPACARDASSAHLDIVLDPGVYAIVVDSEDGAGAYQLAVSSRPADADIAPGITLAQSCASANCCVAGSTVASTDSTGNPCSTIVSPTDVFYRFDPPQGCSTTINSIGVSSLTPHWISAIKTCDTGVVVPIGCAGDPTQGGGGAWSALLKFNNLPTGQKTIGPGCSLLIRVSAETDTQVTPSGQAPFTLNFRPEFTACPTP